MALVIFGLSFACLGGCSASSFEPSKMTLQLVPGSYEAVISGSRMAKLAVSDDLTFKYVEDSTRNGIIKQVMRSGTLRFSTWRMAKAGNIRLEWVSGASIKVVSPFGSTIGHGNNEGNLAYSSGPFLTGMPSHTFYLNRVKPE